MEHTYLNCSCEGCAKYREEKQIVKFFCESELLVNQYLTSQGYGTDTAT